ncbi:MAG: hypothetical protein A3F25_02935 [Candidatus Yanofskybacteria bacterium RIFCSPHIGHO2_12_FULL_45_19b]|uniref:Uncharacterized protein n=1 Tax=Candidatus Yanofskybacteria bacterium RIFCSPHIGHO2_12_FULL_45_19b TaxID=1802689 RepID=A0A1F8G120_9BACT|nr:MAG: hypothetical protein A3F25_02935 [Candidatus Yanofskybacteria bacterium RIFCSPHIGHO2_12_FULL_45_19b]
MSNEFGDNKCMFCNRQAVSFFMVFDENDEPDQIVGESVYFCTSDAVKAAEKIRQLRESPQDLVFMRSVIDRAWIKMWL